MADSEVDTLVHTYETPAQTATKEELREALKQTQLELARAQVDLRAKDLFIEDLQKTAGRKSKSKATGPDPLNYLDIIVTLGKKFGVMQEPWVSPAAFSARPEDGIPPHNTPNEIDALFKTPALYLQYLTCKIYNNVPDKYHELVNALTFPNFRDNFLKHLSAGCSSAVDRLKTNVDKILIECSIKNEVKELLYFPGEDAKRPPSTYPPIFHASLKKDAKGWLLNEAPPLALRCMIFGGSSIKNKGKTKPSTNTLGYAWKLDSEGLTIEAIAFTLIALIFVLHGTDTAFEEKGKITNIPYQSLFRTYVCRLMKHANTPGVRKVLRFWHKIVFAGVATAEAIEDAGMNDSEAEAASDAEFAAAMEGINLGDDAGGFDAGGFDSDDDRRDNDMQLEAPVNAPVPLVNVPVASLVNVPSASLVNAPTPSANTPVPAVNAHDDEVPIAAGNRARGISRQGRGVGRGAGRGLMTIQSDDDLEEAAPAPARQTRSRRSAQR
ncbi:hypothetical protein DFH07DRAFT_965751 [Mycena maculata]|uniref:Uncharacterized protein n=1 Tax=Mycena maculata TaxID=230809 RepID=A0AAD7MZT3_9AGAR|nr:hypothetical protein DFH07DRAFT_965751 [Mycena maculata]